MLASYVIPVGAQDPPPEGDNPPALVDGGGDPSDEEETLPEDSGDPGDGEETLPGDSGEPPDGEAPPDEDGPDEGSPPPEEAGLFSMQSAEIQITSPVDEAVIPGGQVTIEGLAPAEAAVLITIAEFFEGSFTSHTVDADETGYFTHTFTLPEGTYYATASTGELISEEIWFYVDMSGPDIEVYFPDYDGEEVLLSGFVDDWYSALGPVFVSVNGGAEEPLPIGQYGRFSLALEGLRNGANQIFIRALDEHGYESTVTFTIPDTYQPITLTLYVDNTSLASGETVTVTGSLDWVYPGMNGVEAVIKFNPNHLALPLDWEPGDAVRGTFFEGPDGDGFAEVVDETDDEVYLLLSVWNWHQANLLSKTAFTVPLQVRSDVEGHVQTQLALASVNPDYDPFMVLVGEGSLPPSMRGYDPTPVSLEFGDPPPVRITAPHHDTVIPGAVTVDGKASANSWVLVRVEDLAHEDTYDEEVQADAAGYFTASFTLPDGWYSVTAAIEDFVSDAIRFYVDVSGPEIWVSFPEYMDGYVKLTGDIWDRQTAVESAYLAVNGEEQPLEIDEWDSFEVTLEALRSGANRISIRALDALGHESTLEFDLPDVYDPPTLSLSVNGTSFRPGDTVTITGNVDWIYPGITGVGATIAYDPTYLELLPEWDRGDVIVGTFLEGPDANIGFDTKPGESDDEAYLVISFWNWYQGNLDSRKAFTVPLRIKEDAPIGGQTSITIQRAPDSNLSEFVLQHEAGLLRSDELDYIDAPVWIQISDAAVIPEIPLTLTSPVVNAHGYVNARPLQVAGTAPAHSDVTVTVRVSYYDVTDTTTADANGAFALTFSDLELGPMTIYVTAGEQSLPPLTFKYDTYLQVDLHHPVIEDGQAVIAASVDDALNAEAILTIDPDGEALQIPMEYEGWGFVAVVPLTNGVADVQLTVKDLAGNIVVRRFTVRETDGPAQLRFETDQPSYVPGDLVAVTAHLDPVSPALTGVVFWLSYDPDILEVVQYDEGHHLDLSESIFGGDAEAYLSAPEENPGFVQISLMGGFADTTTTKLLTMHFRVLQEVPNGDAILSLKMIPGIPQSPISLWTGNPEADFIPHRTWAMAVVPIGPAEPTLRLTLPGPGAFLSTGQVAVEGFAPDGETVMIAVVNLDNPDVPAQERFVTAVGGSFHEQFELIDGHYRVVVEAEDAKRFVRTFTVDTEAPPLDDVELYGYLEEDGRIWLSLRVNVRESNLDAFHVQINGDGAPMLAHWNDWNPLRFDWQGYAPDASNFQVILTATDRAGNQTVHVIDVERVALDLQFDKLFYQPGDEVKVTAHLSAVPPDLDEVHLRLGLDPNVLAPLHDDGIPRYDLTNALLHRGPWGAVSGQSDWVSFMVTGDRPESGTTKVVTLHFRVKEDAPLGVTYLEVQDLRAYPTDLPTLEGNRFEFLVSDSAGQGGISGEVTFDGDATRAGTAVRAYHGGEVVAETWTDEQGQFHVGELDAGYVYTLVFTRPGYLSLTLHDVPVYSDGTTDLSHMVLALSGGNLLDTAHSVDRVYLEDLGVMARALWGDADSVADLNGDGKVDQADLNLLRMNYGQAGAGSGEPSAPQVIYYVPVP